MFGIAYDAFEEGHRRPYLDMWQRELGLRSVIEPPSFILFLKFLRAQRLLFSTLDDVPFFFFVVAFGRALLGRKTVGIFMRPHVCFYSDHWKYRVKWLYFRILSAIPLSSPVSIIPYFVNERFSEISCDWIYDPQNWDLVNSCPNLQLRTELAERILAHARGRKIIAAIGGLNRFKGFDYAAEIVLSAGFDPDRFVFIACGPLAHDCHDMKAKIEMAGGLVIGTFISDADIMAIYGIADLVWACYPPRNDQASGIFGRASQLGVPAIVRAGSFNAIQAGRIGAPALPIPWNEPDCASTLINSTPIYRKEPNWELIGVLRAQSLTRLQGHL